MLPTDTMDPADLRLAVPYMERKAGTTYVKLNVFRADTMREGSMAFAVLEFRLDDHNAAFWAQFP